MSFARLIGQSNVKMRLGSALQGGPGHAYLFTGPAGIGKRSFALAFAKALLCEHANELGSCDRCPSCRHFDHGVHADFCRIALEDKEKNIKVERVRQQVSADLSIQPQLGRRKVYLLDGDNLNEQGQNALLKSLEEPPDYAVFLLTASGPERLLATVLSRVTVLQLQRYCLKELIDILHGAGYSDEDDLDFFVRYANGLPGAALELVGNPQFGELRKSAVELFFSLPSVGRTWLLTEGYAYFDEQRDHARLILDILASLVRDQLVLAGLDKDTLLINRDLSSRLRSDIPVNDACARLARCHDAILKTGRALALNASFEGLVCNLLLSLRKELSHA